MKLYCLLYAIKFCNPASCIEYCKPSASTEDLKGQSLLQAGSYFWRPAHTEKIPRWACAVHSHREFDKESKFQMHSLSGPLRVQKSSEGGENHEVQSVDASGLEALVSKEDVLVFFYAPWCPHCQKLILAEDAPIERLSKLVKDKVKVVKLDITAQQVPSGYQVKVIPAIYFANKNVKVEYKKDPEDFGAVEKFVSESQQKKEEEEKDGA